MKQRDPLMGFYFDTMYTLFLLNKECGDLKLAVLCTETFLMYQNYV